MKNERTKLLNGCSRTAVFISPKKYKTFTAKSNFLKQWFIQCRFFDPLFEEQYPEGFPYRVKFSGDKLPDLKLKAEIFLEEMEMKLDQQNFNPITKVYMTDRVGDLHPNLDLITALEEAHKKLTPFWSIDHGKEVKRCINHVRKHLLTMRFYDVLIHEVKTWHVKTILDAMELPDVSYNRFRSYLQSLFKELTQYGCCDYNPVDNISIKTETKHIREVITEEKLKYVYKHLQTKCYSFFRYGKIFFYSGGRSTEFMQLQRKHVDLENQEYQVLIKKGKRKTWVKKIIIPAAVPYWKEILALCEDNEDYLFSKGLIPGEVPISAKQISRRWKRHVKDSEEIKDGEGNIIKVTEDFYSLKHLFLDILDEMQTAPIIPIPGKAQRMGAHTTPKTTGIYTTGREERKNKDLKKLMIS